MYQDVMDMMCLLANGPKDQRKDLKAALKAKLKAGLVRGVDGRLHGDQKRMSKHADSLVDCFAHRCKHPGSTEATFTDDVLRDMRKTAPKSQFALENLEPLWETSAVARRLFISRFLSEEGYAHLIIGDFVSAVSCYGAAYRLADLPVELHSTTVPLEVQFDIFTSIGADSSRPSQLRADACLVRAFLLASTGNVGGAAADLLVAIELLPADPVLHVIRGTFLHTLGKGQDALQCYEHAWNLCSGQELANDWLLDIPFLRATILDQRMNGFKHCNQSQLEARQCYEEYLKIAPKDTRKLCEACYHLAMIEHTANRLGAARRMLDKGLDAEGQRLACFQEPRSNWRRSAEVMLKNYHACGAPDCPHVGVSHCAHCHKVHYCGKACQKAHWKVHKLTCAVEANSNTLVGTRGKSSKRR